MAKNCDWPNRPSASSRKFLQSVGAKSRWVPYMGGCFQHARPLVGCNVVIVPMHADGATDDNGIRHPLSATTDSDGMYAFVNVPIGPYKLTWLPARTTQWIRRIEMKPDVFVREGQDTTLKDIGRALRQ